MEYHSLSKSFNTPPFCLSIFMLFEESSEADGIERLHCFCSRAFETAGQDSLLPPWRFRGIRDLPLHLSYSSSNPTTKTSCNNTPITLQLLRIIRVHSVRPRKAPGRCHQLRVSRLDILQRTVAKTALRTRCCSCHTGCGGLLIAASKTSVQVRDPSRVRVRP